MSIEIKKFTTGIKYLLRGAFLIPTASLILAVLWVWKSTDSSEIFSDKMPFILASVITTICFTLGLYMYRKSKQDANTVPKVAWFVTGGILGYAIIGLFTLYALSRMEFPL